ncbi:MAG: LLM class F420-dependent oxidoreductase [Microthrixaceae bacterium]
MDLRIFVEPQQGASYDQQLAVAQRAEALGFDAFFRSDHYLRMGEGSPLPGPTDSWITLAGIARETSTIRLGTLVSSGTFRLPGPLAIAVAQVDVMSEGRVELGMGAGWFDAEHLAYGIPFPPLGERFDRLEEQLEILQGLWHTPVGETFTHHGEHWTVEDSPALPKPVQPVGPPIIVGGAGPRRTPALAARFATEFNTPFLSLDDAIAMNAKVDEACQAVGRDPVTLRRSSALVLCAGADEGEIARRAASIGREVPELRQNGLAGRPEELVAKLADFARIGVSRAYLQVLDLDDLDHLELVAAEVLPAVAEL